MPPSPSPRVALLVLAHSAPAVLELLASGFGDDRFRILVHLDRKVDLDGYVRGLTLPASVTFIEERHEIFWGGFSMVRATESLSRAALADPSVGTCMLLSDDSLPLVPPDLVHAELLARPDRIDVSRGWMNPAFESRYTGYFHFDAPATSVRPVEPHRRQVDPPTLAALDRLARLRDRGKFPLPRVWCGSQWWSLGRATLEPILDELAGNEWLRESLEFSAVPDEIAFQSLYANRLGLTTRSHTSPMLTDMTRTPVPFIYRSIDEIPQDPPGKLFVRKIDPAAAGPIMAGLRTRRGAD
jgi:hypothetical protein